MVSEELHLNFHNTLDFNYSNSVYLFIAKGTIWRINGFNDAPNISLPLPAEEQMLNK
jgi:hypothetical protein